MKEPARSRKMNQLINEKKESIQAKLSDESFRNWLDKTLDALITKNQQQAEDKECA